MKKIFSQGGSSHAGEPLIKRKIILSVLAIAAAVSLLTGCYPKYNFSPDYENGYSIVESSSQSVTSVESTISSVTSSPSSSSTAPESSVSDNTESSSTYTHYSAEPIPDITPNDAPKRTKPLDTKSEEFVTYTTGNSELSYSSYYTPYLFDFRPRMAVGYSIHDFKNQLSVEADYGIKGVFDGSVMTVQTYDHTGQNIVPTASYIEALDASADKKVSDSFGPAPKRYETANLPNGLYRISVTFSNANTAKLYFLVNGDEYQFCQMIKASSTSYYPNYNIDMIRARRAHVYRLLDEWDVTPENSLSVDIIKYPCIDYSDSNGRMLWRCDTDLWAQLSDDLVDPAWSDERKAYVICDWMSQNLAYDYYVSDVIKVSRNVRKNNTTGKYSVWELKCGVCRDFGQILAIMFRQQGIPAEVIANDTHLWNIAYLNGRWIEIDICYSQTECVDGDDTTVRRPSSNDYLGLLSMRGQNNNDHYGTSLHKYLYMGQESFD